MFLEEYKNVVSTFATVVTIIQFLSGIDICRNIIKLESTGDITGLPFVVGSFATSMWLTYSFLLSDMPMMITNFVGLCTQIIYLLIYINYCVSLGPWRTLRKQMLSFGLIFIAIAYYTLFGGDADDSITRNIGLVCCISSIIFCISPLASLREVFRTKSTAVLPFPLILSMFFVGGSWCLYGLIIQNSFIVYPNFLVFCLAGFQLLLFLVFPSKVKDPTDCKSSLSGSLYTKLGNDNVEDDFVLVDKLREQHPHVHHYLGRPNDGYSYRNAQHSES